MRLLSTKSTKSTKLLVLFVLIASSHQYSEYW